MKPLVVLGFAYIICTIFLGAVFGIPDIDKCYQDLTDPIDKIIHDHDPRANEVLQKALNLSTRVYYSTDMPMNNIMDMLPVINLLNQSKPEGTTISIILSLRYTYQNRFSRPDLDDVYYDLSLNITKDSWKNISTYVTHIVLDWNTFGCEDGDYFFSKPGSWSTEKIGKISFPMYIKSFISFYCGEEEGCQVPVGIAFNSSQMDCTNYLNDQIEYADFHITTVTFPSYKRFPLTEENYTKYINGASFWNGKPNYVNLNIVAKPTASEATLNWSSNMKSLLQSSSHFNEAMHTLIETVYWKNVDYISKHIFIMASSGYHSFRESDRVRVIFGNTIRLYLEDEQFNSANVLPAIMISGISTDELSTSGCDLALQLNYTSGNGSLIVNPGTWRAASRYNSSIVNYNTVCRSSRNFNDNYWMQQYYDNDEDENFEHEYFVKNKIMLIFDNGIRKRWQTNEKNMERLINNTRQVGNATLTTIVFHEDDISHKETIFETSTGYGAQDGQIANFIRKWDKEFSTGCVINFTEQRIESLFTRSLQRGFRELVVQFCKPIFDILDVIILQGDNKRDSINDQYSGNSDYLVAARSVFLKEFPDKEIVIQFGYKVSYDALKTWANYYEVPVIFGNM